MTQDPRSALYLRPCCRASFLDAAPLLAVALYSHAETLTNRRLDVRVYVCGIGVRLLAVAVAGAARGGRGASNELRRPSGKANSEREKGGEGGGGERDLETTG